MASAQDPDFSLAEHINEDGILTIPDRAQQVSEDNAREQPSRNRLGLKVAQILSLQKQSSEKNKKQNTLLFRRLVLLRYENVAYAMNKISQKGRRIDYQV